MIDDNTSYSTEKINYGDEFLSVLDCASEILENLDFPLSYIRDLSMKLRNTPKRIGILRYKSNPDFKNTNDELYYNIEKLKGSAEKKVKEFNEKNKKEMRLISQESVERDSYSCSIGTDVGNGSISGRIWFPSFPITVDLDETFSMKSSYLLDSLRSLENIVGTSLEIKRDESYKGYLPDCKLVFLPDLLSSKGLAEMIEGLNKGMCAKLSLQERGSEPDFFSTIVFRPKGTTTAEVKYTNVLKPDKKEKKEWLEKNVNIITGYNLPKSV